MMHPTVAREPNRYLTATVDAATRASFEKTLRRRGTVLWCGRLISYYGAVGGETVMVHSVCLGADETNNNAALSAAWQTRINERASA